MKKNISHKKRGGAFMRTRGLVRKEFFQIIRDPSSIAIAFVMPVILLILFGYGVSLDIKHVPVAVVLEDQGKEAANFVSELEGSEYFELHIVSNANLARQKITEGKVKAIITIKQNFTRNIKGYVIIFKSVCIKP